MPSTADTAPRCRPRRLAPTAALCGAAALLLACEDPPTARPLPPPPPVTETPAVTPDAPDAPDPDPKLDAIQRMYADYRADFPGVPEVNADQAAASEPGRPVVLVDCREPWERAVSSIPGAVTPEQLRADPGRYADTRVIVYCTIGYRSGLAARELRHEGFDAYNLVGGVLGWAHSGRGFTTPTGEPTDRVHVYGRRWSLLPEGFEPVY